MAADEAPTASLGQMLLYLWRLSRPEFWMVSILPFYVGHLMAGMELFPGLAGWLDFWTIALKDGASAGDLAWELIDWWENGAWRFVSGLIVMGPLLWTATLLINDVHDLAGDRANPRKGRSPLVQGLVGRGHAHVGAYVAATFALALAWPLGRQFTGLVLLCLLLAWLYSVPPVRLKTRPGADVLVNAVGVGALSFLAGWSVIVSLAAVPWVFVIQGLLVAAAVYIPTTLVDYEADRAAAYLTLATHLGPERAYRIGLVCWYAANAGALWLSWHDEEIPREMFPILAVFVPVLLLQYHVSIGRARDPIERVRGIGLTSFTFLAVNVIFALMYTRIWV